MRMLLGAALVVLGSGLAAGATTRKTVAFKRGLGHVVVKVNGDQTAVPAGETLHVYRGDNVVFLAADSRDPALRPASLTIDIEGIAAGSPERGERDYRDKRGVEIVTASLESKAYPVTVRYGEKVVGRIKLVVAEPRFDYAVVLVNGRPVTVRAGGKVNLKPSDAVRVQSVRTNIPDPSRIEVDALTDGGSLRFKYRGRVFGEIRMPVSGARSI